MAGDRKLRFWAAARALVRRLKALVAWENEEEASQEPRADEEEGETCVKT